jgi:hypothetical protein
MSQANGTVGYDLVLRDGLANLIEKSLSLSRLGNRRKYKSSRARFEWEIDADDFPEPWEKVGKTLSTESRVAIAGYGYRSRFIDRKSGVFKSP